ncbi:dynein beta chain, ciliary-like [Procambarus clarkii]|uniref:dynein beta chain, ciliary-like n=1 Tax=Procambarus clarkii TaxID=6728 RepID=UPI00374352F4
MAVAVEGDRENWDVLGEYTNKTLRLKADRWTKAVQHDDTRSTLLEFLDSNSELVVVSLNLSNQLVATSEVPAGLRTKGVYFLKACDVPLVREEDTSNVRDHVIFGDISPQPLDQLSTLIEEVIIPMLENPANRSGWPEMVCEDLSQQLYSLRGTVYRMWGQLRGQTLLPLPFGLDTLEKAERHALDTGEMTDSQLKSAIEGVVIKWVHQVEEVLTQDTEDLAAPDYFPKPLEEITFWSKRRENLTHISSQLKDKKVRMMSNILEVTESAYYPAFVKMCADVTMGELEVYISVEESRDIMVHLTPLKPLLEGLEGGEFQDTALLIPPLMHCICLLWVSCSAYRKPDRIVTLFKEIANLLISMGRTFIGTVGFQAETTEPLLKINTCVSVLKCFRDSFQEHREKVASYFKEGEKPRRWEFHPNNTFARMDQFLARLANIKEIFDVAKEFLKIEKVEFGGPKGKVLGANISAVYRNNEIIVYLDCKNAKDTYGIFYFIYGLTTTSLKVNCGHMVVVSLNLSNQLVATSEVPAGLRTKGVYFLKACDVPLVREEDTSNVRDHVIFGDISPQPLDQLSTLIEEVIIPMLENPANRSGWPEMVCEDLSQQLYSLRGTVYRMWGQLRGQTLLPLPFGLDTLEKAERHALDT